MHLLVDDLPRSRVGDGCLPSRFGDLWALVLRAGGSALFLPCEGLRGDFLARGGDTVAFLEDAWACGCNCLLDGELCRCLVGLSDRLFLSGLKDRLGFCAWILGLLLAALALAAKDSGNLDLFFPCLMARAAD